jgi:hypothetical protein
MSLFAFIQYLMEIYSLLFILKLINLLIQIILKTLIPFSKLILHYIITFSAQSLIFYIENSSYLKTVYNIQIYKIHMLKIKLKNISQIMEQSLAMFD